MVTYPRSGTTWTQEMVWNILNNCDFDAARKKDIDKKFFFLDMDFLGSGTHGDNPGFVERAVAAAAAGEQRLIKSHLPLGLLPPSLLSTARVIYVGRNPKDVVVSYYHHHRLTKSVEPDLTFPEFVRVFMAGLLVEDPYMAHLQEAVKLRTAQPNLKFLWYEDMKHDLPDQIREVAAFLGQSLTEYQVASLAEYLDFQNMKKNPAVNHQDRHSRGAFATGESFIRKGEAGGWKKYFDGDLEKEFDAWIEEQTKDVKIDFKWN